MSLSLYQHQQDILNKNPARHLLSWDTGVGKTLTAILWGNQFKHVLIICPKHLVKQWERAIKEHGKATFYVISKEQFRIKWDTLPQFDAIVGDEAHYFAGMKSALSKNLIKYIKLHSVQFIWLLTATPYMSTPWNIYRLAQILGYKWNYWEFSNRFFFQVRMGARMIPQVRPGIEDDIAELVQRIGSTVDIYQHFDVPDQNFLEPEFFELTKEQQKRIASLKGEEVNPAVRYNYIHQVENGALKARDAFSKDEFFDADKHRRIEELVDEHKKIAIICKYTLQLEYLQEVFKKKGKTVFLINGETKDKDEEALDADAADECVCLINAACSEGYELPSIDFIVFASFSFSYKDYKQIIGRFLRGNKLKKNTYLPLVNEGTVDNAVYNSILKKESFDISIYVREQERC